MKLQGLARQLARFDAAETGWAALRLQAEALAETMRAGAGALVAHVGVAESDDALVVGIAHPGAAAREFGTPRRAPDPIVGPAAMEAAPQIAASVQGAVADALRAHIQGGG